MDENTTQQPLGGSQQQDFQQQQGFQQGYAQSSPPAIKLNSSRSLLKYFLFGIITLGIYPVVFMSGISSDINTIATKKDGRKTMHYLLLMFIVTPITLGIGAIVWYHNLSDRVGRELYRRGISYKFSATDFWLWNVLGAIIIVGPFIYLFKLANATNALADDFNARG